MIIKFCKNNRLLNKVFNVNNAINRNDINLYNHDVIKKIIKLSFDIDLNNYDLIVDDNLQSSQYIVLEHNNVRKYILFSYECPSGARNGYLLSKSPIAFREYYRDDFSNKHFEICLLGVEETIYNLKKDSDQPYTLNELHLDSIQHMGSINNYNIFAYRLLKTLGARIINQEALPFDYFIEHNTEPQSSEYVLRKDNIDRLFKDVNELRKSRLSCMGNNTGNKSSYLIELLDKIFVYGKTFGNNQFESVMIGACACLLGKKDNKKTYFYQIKDVLGVNGFPNRLENYLTTENYSFLQNYGLDIIDEIRDYTDNPEINYQDIEKDVRSQAEFIRNLMIKYGEPGKEDVKKCYICNNEIQETIIASHIQRVADIKNLDLTFEQKREKAIDGNNGFWLCATHDKLFEFGLISFNEYTGNFVVDSNRIKDSNLDYINEITKKYQIEDKHLTESLKDYLSFHNTRIRKIYNVNY